MEGLLLEFRLLTFVDEYYLRFVPTVKTERHDRMLHPIRDSHQNPSTAPCCQSRCAQSD
jgi:hypothetical protein